MYRRDYLVKMAEEYAKAIALLMGLKWQGKYSELESLMDELALKYTPLQIETCEALEEAEFLEELVVRHSLNELQLKVIADLLFEKGELYLTRQQDEQAQQVFRKSLMLYRYIAENSTAKDFSLDLHYRMKLLESRIIRGL